MKTNSINKVIFSLALFLSVGLTTVAQDDVVFIEESDFSQIDFSAGGSNLQQMFSDLSAAVELGPDPGPPPTNLPLDGGLSLLLAAGVGYGANRLRKNRKLRLLICFLVVNMYCLEHLITQIFSQNWQNHLKKNIYWGSNFEINHIFILQVSRILPHHLPLIHQVQ
jgi:hypothetical protein